jgi:hypothetical protein
MGRSGTHPLLHSGQPHKPWIGDRTESWMQKQYDMRFPPELEASASRVELLPQFLNNIYAYPHLSSLSRTPSKPRLLPMLSTERSFGSLTSASSHSRLNLGKPSLNSKPSLASMISPSPDMESPREAPGALPGIYLKRAQSANSIYTTVYW